MQPTIEMAKSSNTLNKLTFVLLYATDFADRLEKEIIPALKAGLRRPLRPLHLHRARARRRARRRPGVAAQPLRVRDRAAPGLLPQDRRRDADRARPRVARHGLLGIGHGPEARRRHLRQLPRLPEQAAARIRLDGRRIPLPDPSTPAARSITSRTSCAGRSRRSWSRRRSRSNRSSPGRCRALFSPRGLACPGPF